MESIEHRVARDLFDHARVVGRRLQAQDGISVPGINDTDKGDIFEFHVTFLELIGKRATDLVEPSTEVDTNGNPIRSGVAIHEDKVIAPFATLDCLDIDSSEFRSEMCDLVSSLPKFGLRAS